MKLILGGAAQGKCAYASRLFDLPYAAFLEGETAMFHELRKARGVNHFHLFVRRELAAGNRELTAQVEALIQENPALVFLCDEVGCGVVPMDAFEREYRETVGRLCCLLAQHAERVDRVFCGLGTVLKEETR